MFPPSFSSGGFEWSWDWGYELTAAEAMSLVLGLGAITATLSVAVVAASWRTDTDCPGTERRVDAWNVGMQGVLKMLAILSVTSSLLVDHSRWVLGVLLIAASLLTAIVAVRIVERPALFSMAMEEFVLERKVRRLADSVEEQERRCPWLRRYSQRMLPSVIEIAAVVLVSMTAQLMIPLMYFIAYFAWVPSLSVLDLFTSENRLALGSWIDAGAPIAFAAVASGSLSGSLVIWSQIISRETRVGSLASRAVSVAGVTTLALLTLFIAVGTMVSAWRHSGSLAGAGGASTLTAYPMVMGLLLLAGRRGHRPGSGFWSIRYGIETSEKGQAEVLLDRERRRRELLEQLRRESAPKPAPDSTFHSRLGAIISGAWRSRG